jgi:signal recognition particle subunit SRP54
VFDDLARRFTRLFSGLSRNARLTEKNIEEGIQEVRTALLEADVNLQVVEGFVARVRAKALGVETLKGVSPAQHFVGIVQQELEALLGGAGSANPTPRIRWSDRGPTVIMLVGLQGTGKTTTCGKIARHLRKKEGKRPLLVAADVQRPAAVEQLKVLGRQLDLPVYAEEGGRPPKICRRGVDKAIELGCDVVLLDTAGRLHIDTDLMDELTDIKDKIQPHEIWLVVDAMLGQDAVRSAQEFHQRLNVTGFVLTKADGDSRGGAVLAVREVTGQPVRFVGVGEKLEQLEAFDPARMAQRILGLGDVVGLVEDAQERVDQAQAQEAAEKLFKDTFTLDDLRGTLEQIQRMGPMREILKKLPGGQGLSQDQLSQLDDRQLSRWCAAISSMTPSERRDPSLLHGQRRNRVARGSGTSASVIGEVVKAHKQMQTQMRAMKQGGFMQRMAAGMFDRQKNKQLKDLRKRGTDMRGWFDPPAAPGAPSGEPSERN